MSLKVIIIKVNCTTNILIKIPKGGLIKRFNYIFKLFKFKLGCGEDFITVIINCKTAYILAINNINYNIVVSRY